MSWKRILVWGNRCKAYKYLIRQATGGDAVTIQSIAEQTWWPAYLPILEKEQIQFMLNELYAVNKITDQISNILKFIFYLLKTTLL